MFDVSNDISSVDEIDNVSNLISSMDDVANMITGSDLVCLADIENVPTPSSTSDKKILTL